MSRKVIVNGRCLARPTTGVERYAREVTRCFADRVDVAAPDGCRRGVSGHVWEQVMLPRAVNGSHLLWSPANTGPLSVRRQVVTIHDVSAIEHPEWFTPGFAAWYGYLLPRLSRRAARVIAVSHFTRERIIERLGVPEARVCTIHQGVSDAFAPQPAARAATVCRAYGITSPYLLVVGSIQPRKNLGRLLRVWRRHAGDWPGLHLVIVGSGGAPFPAAGLDARDVARVHLLQTVPDADLPSLYAGALGFVQPSLYEGFGLPVLEAMASGVPVAVSGCSALPEVAGEAALFFDPADDESMAEALRRLVEDDEWRARSRARGRARARNFRWDRTARETWQVLRDVGGES